MKGFKLVNKAMKEREKEKLYQIWLINYKSMDKEHFISFEDWYKKLVDESRVKKVAASLSQEDILKQVEMIRERAVAQRANI